MVDLTFDARVLRLAAIAAGMQGLDLRRLLVALVEEYAATVSADEVAAVRGMVDDARVAAAARARGPIHGDLTARSPADVKERLDGIVGRLDKATVLSTTPPEDMLARRRRIWEAACREAAAFPLDATEATEQPDGPEQPGGPDAR